VKLVVRRRLKPRNAKTEIRQDPKFVAEMGRSVLRPYKEILAAFTGY